MLLPLNRKGDFKKAFESGLKFSSASLILYAKPNELSYSRLGLSVNRKIGNAVKRNRIKRRIREVFRRYLMDRQLKYDFIVIARRDSVKAGFADLNNNLYKFLAGLTDEKHIDTNCKTI